MKARAKTDITVSMVSRTQSEEVVIHKGDVGELIDLVRPVVFGDSLFYQENSGNLFVHREWFDENLGD